MFQLIRLAIVFILIMFIIVTAVAQTSEPSPTPSEAERRLQAEIERLKLEKIKAELERDVRNAQPQPTATPLTGDVTGAKDLKMEINLQTYRALRRVTDRIACDITTNVINSKPKVFVLYKAEVYQALINYRSMQKPLNEQLDTLRADYETLLVAVKPPPNNNSESLAAGIPLALRSLADILSLFRTNVDFNYSAVTINENALKSMMSNSLRKQKPCEKSDNSFSSVYINNGLTIYDPEIFYPVTDGDSKLIGKISEIMKQKQKASEFILIFDMQTLKAETAKKNIESEETSLATLKAKIQAKIEERLLLENKLKKTRASAARRELAEKIGLATEELTKLEEKRSESITKKSKAETEFQVANNEIRKYNKFVIAILKQLNTEFTQFYTALMTRDTSGQSPLSQLVKIEALADILDKAPNETYWLSIRSVDAGGTARVRKNLFRNFYYPDIAINGGSIVEYTLSRPNGEIVISNVNNVVQEFRKPGNIYREIEKDNK